MKWEPALFYCPIELVIAMQIVKAHDVDAAVKILFEHAGPHFQEQVIKWGAVHADQRR